METFALKISFVYDAAYPWVKGGVEKRIYELSNRLSNRGHDVRIYTFKRWDGPDIVKYDGVTYCSLGGKKGLYNHGRRSFVEAIYFAIRTFRIKVSKHEIVDVQSFPYFHLFPLKIITLLKRGTFVVTWHEVWKDYWIDYLNKKFYLGILGIAIENLSAHLTNNNIGNSLTTVIRLNSINRGSAEMIPNGVDINQFKEIEASSKKYDLVSTSRFVREKRLDVLVRAVGLLKATYPHIRAIFIGDGPEYASVRRLIHDLGLDDNIELTGFLDKHESVISIVKSSKVFVSASIREGFFLSALEAMACGVPSVLTLSRMNAGVELINSEPITGWVSSCDFESLARTLELALHGYQGLRTNCLTKAASFDWNLIVNRLLLYYEKIQKDILTDQVI